MIREEYNYHELSDYMHTNIDFLIAGFPKEQEERSCFFIKEWRRSNKNYMLIDYIDDRCFDVELYYGNVNNKIQCDDISYLLKELKINKMNVLLDITSLNHVLIVLLSKFLTIEVVPNTLFASYIRPKSYIAESGLIDDELSEKVLEVKPFPRFAKRAVADEILCAFIGFEANRLKKILELPNDFSKIIAVITASVGKPHWSNTAMFNSVEVIESQSVDVTISKCFAESVFEAYDILESNRSYAAQQVIVPLGTRPHTLACGLYASKNHKNTRIIYDFAVESAPRTIGISHITIYNLSAFLQAQ